MTSNYGKTNFKKYSRKKQRIGPEQEFCLLDDKSGPICSHISGYLLMPLYQNKGNEGFLYN